MKSILLTYFIFFLVALFLDQSTKFLATQSGIIVVQNSGVSLGLGSHIPNSVLSVSLVGFLVFFFFALRTFWLKYPALSGVFFGSSISNVLDRIFLGGVRDWIFLPSFSLRNNIADCLLLCAIAGIAWKEMRKK